MAAKVCISEDDLQNFIGELDWFATAPFAKIGSLSELHSHLNSQGADFDLDEAAEHCNVFGERPVMLFDELTLCFLVARIRNPERLSGSLRLVPFSILFRLALGALSVKMQAFLASCADTPEPAATAVSGEDLALYSSGLAASVPPRLTSLARSDSGSNFGRPKAQLVHATSVGLTPKRSASFVGAHSHYVAGRLSLERQQDSRSQSRPGSKRGSVSRLGGDLEAKAAAQRKKVQDLGIDPKPGLYPISNAAYFYGLLWEGQKSCTSVFEDSDPEDYHSMDDESSDVYPNIKSSSVLDRKVLLEQIWLDDKLPLAALRVQIPLDIPELKSTAQMPLPPELITVFKVSQEQGFKSVELDLSDPEKPQLKPVTTDSGSATLVTVSQEPEWCESDAQSVSWLLAPVLNAASILCAETEAAANVECADLAISSYTSQLAPRSSAPAKAFSCGVAKAWPVVQSLNPLLHLPAERSELDHSIVGIELCSFDCEPVYSYYDHLRSLCAAAKPQLLVKLERQLATLRETLRHCQRFKVASVSLEQQNSRVSPLVKAVANDSSISVADGCSFSFQFMVSPNMDSYPL